MPEETPTARTIRLIQEEERERCAKIAEGARYTDPPGTIAIPNFIIWQPHQLLKSLIMYRHPPICFSVLEKSGQRPRP